MKSKTTTLPALFCLTALTAALLTGCGNANNAFERYVKNGDYGDAIDCYQEDIQGNTRDEQEASEFLNTYLEEQLEGYASGSRSKSDFRVALDTVSQIDAELYLLEDGIWWIEESYYSIADSKSSYDYAQEYLTEGEISRALQSLSYVCEEDTEHYEKAQEQLTAIVQQFEEEKLEEMKEWYTTFYHFAWDPAYRETLAQEEGDTFFFEEFLQKGWDMLTEIADIGEQCPVAQATCNRLLSYAAYGWVHLEYRPTEEAPADSLEAFAEKVITYRDDWSYELLGYEGGLAWLEITFTPEMDEIYRSLDLYVAAE